MKRLNDNMPIKTFYTKVVNLIVFNYENIVQLVGFCHELERNVISTWWKIYIHRND